MAQDFWASSGFRDLDATPEGLRPTPAWLAGFLSRDELAPPAEAGPRERALHARLSADPLARVPAADLAAVEDDDARHNWRTFLAFRDHVAAHPTLEEAYRALFAAGDVRIAPVFVDALAQVLVRAALDGSDDPWLARAGEMLHRRQRVSTDGGRVLAADAATIEVYAETGGFGNVGRLLRQQNTPTPEVKMDVMDVENAPLYYLRDELYGFVLDITPGAQGANALAAVLERWIGRVAGVRVMIEPVSRIDDGRWRWHVGLDAEATSLLNALYRGEALAAAQRQRLLVLFRLAFADEREALPEVRGRPVWLGLACREDRTLKLKPQNLLTNLPLAGVVPTGG